MISTVKSCLSCYAEHMQWLSNRYVQLALLTLFIAVLIYFIIWLIFVELLGLHAFPAVIHLTLSILGAGLFVYKFFASRIF